MQCDRCNAHAYVHVVLDTGGRLSWCGHHYREHEEALMAYVVEMVDQRDLLEA